MTERCVSWEDLAESVAPSGIGKRTLAGRGATLVRIAIPAGASAGRHSHPHEQFVQVISGSGTLETEAGRRDFGPSSLFHFPAGTWHAAAFATDTVLVETNLEP